MAWWNKVFRNRAPEEDLDREVAFHIDELIEKNISEGMNPVEGVSPGNARVRRPRAGETGTAGYSGFRHPRKRFI